MLRVMTESFFAAETSAGPIAGWETGAGWPLVFLHGGPGLTDYGQLLTGEAPGWRFISFQQRGLEPSTVEGPFTLEQHVADAVAVLDARGVERAVVVGHSFGAHLALHLAVAHPERVAGLVLVDGLGVVGDGGVSDLGRALAARLLPGAAERLQQLMEEAGEAPTDDQATEQLALLWPGYFAEPRTAPAPPSGMRICVAANIGTTASVTEHLEAGFAASLTSIGVPVISVLGSQSPMPVSQGEQTAAMIAGAEVRIVQAAGHLPWHEQPGCVTAALADLAGRAGLPQPPASLAGLPHAPAG
jgi:pimeloyl-ACP methyl ester carboxylesterase